MLKRIIAIFILVLVVGTGSLIGWNNRSALHVTPSEIDYSLEQAIAWLEMHQDDVLDIKNPALWDMVRRTNKIIKDKRLDSLLAKYQLRWIKPFPNDAWNLYFTDSTISKPSLDAVATLKPYQQLLFFALSCDERLYQQQMIQQQLNPHYCRRHEPLTPACLTHQLMAFEIMRERHCHVDSKLEAATKIIQEKIASQLAWDPRVIDVYIQRAMVLLDSGGGAKLKPIWIRRIIQSQQVDGGWDSFQPLIPLGKENYLGFSNRVLSVRANNSNFHTTAQAMYMLALLYENQPGNVVNQTAE